MMRKTIALLLLAALTLIPSAGAASSDYTLEIRGGQTAQSMAEIDGDSVLKVDLYLNGVTDEKLLTVLAFDLGFSASQLEYLTDSQSLGVCSLNAVNASGEIVSEGQMLINSNNAGSGQLRIVFASDYGCRIKTGMPLISFYFYLAPNMEAGTEIAFTLGSDIEAESVRMTAQTGNATYTRRSVGKNLKSYTVTESTLGTAIRGEIVLDPRDVKYKGSLAYMLYNGKERKPRVTVHNADTGETVDPKYYVLSYRNNTYAGSATVEVFFRRGYAGKCSTWFKIYLAAPTVTFVENKSDGVRLAWSSVNGAKGYVIYRRAWNLSSSGWTSFERWNNTTGTNWIDTKVYPGTRYQYGIKAYPYDPLDNYNLGLVGPLKTTVRITTRTLESVTPGSNRMTVKWSGSKFFTGYQIQYARDEAFTDSAVAIKIEEPGTYETTIRSLKSRTYYVRIRSYHIFEGMNYYGEWSNVLSCKIK